MSSSVNSISFVITAIYTYTFANSVYQLVMFDEASADIHIREGTNFVIVVCASICMTMALRFFFGNNKFIEEVFTKTDNSVTNRLYHFAVISAQSLILLASSFLIRNPGKFMSWIALLFIVELVWYLGCLVCFRGDVSDEQRRLNRELAFNEVANVFIAASALFATTNTYFSQAAVFNLVAVVFVLNTVIDFKVNRRGYMGLSSFQISELPNHSPPPQIKEPAKKKKEMRGNSRK